MRGLPLALAIFAAFAAAQQPIETTPVDYTEEARLAELEGTVLLSGVIGEDGTARDLRVVSSLGLGLDEKAVEAVKQWLFRPGDSKSGTNIPVDFVLPSKQSRWHLIRASFQPPEGASRPVFKATNFPRGAGIGPDAIEEGRLLGGIGRQASAVVSFDIDQTGKPGHFQVDNASLPLWGAEAISLVQEWRFKPAMKDALPVPARCTVDLLWGKINLTADSIERYQAVMTQQPPGSPGPVPVLSHKVEPAYTEDARSAGIQGIVTVSLMINEDGTVHDVGLMKRAGMGLDQSAVDAVSQWRFQPTLVNGAAAPLYAEVVIQFTPNRPAGIVISARVLPK